MDQSTDQKAQQWLLGIGRREEWGVTASAYPASLGGDENGLEFDTDDGSGADLTDVANKIKGGVLDTNEADTLLAILSKGSGSLEYNFGDVSYNYAANSKTAMDFDITMKAEQIQAF